MQLQFICSQVKAISVIAYWPPKIVISLNSFEIFSVAARYLGEKKNWLLKFNSNAAFLWLFYLQQE